MFSNRAQVPAISVTNTPLYTPGDEQTGLAAAGESIAFSLWTNNTGNVDLHDVKLSEDGEHKSITNIQAAGIRNMQSRRTVRTLRFVSCN